MTVSVLIFNFGYAFSQTPPVPPPVPVKKKTKTIETVKIPWDFKNSSYLEIDGTANLAKTRALLNPLGFEPIPDPSAPLPFGQFSAPSTPIVT